MSILVNIQDLLSGVVVEGNRMEFKKGWNPTSIMRSVCAFANDFENEGSGYIVVGVDEENGKPIRPVFGFNPNDLEKIEKEGLFTALEKGIFADIKRPLNGGKGLAGVVEKGANYSNPFVAIMNKNLK